MENIYLKIKHRGQPVSSLKIYPAFSKDIVTALGNTFNSNKNIHTRKMKQQFSRP